ncbi:TonB-dependent receptor [Luteimonas pelagia]
MINLKKLPSAIQFALFVGAASLVSGNALAQDDQEEESDQQATTLDRIQVTGSRLTRADIEGAVPVVTIDREDIDVSGDVSVADVLRDTTFASFGNFKPQSGSSAQALATIDLRGLGSGRTLVLIDGRRAPTSPMAASSGVDVNAIPLAAVERIEILSDGASAVYGSDAIGGVVNIILRKDFDGAELRYGIGQTKVTGGDTEEASAVFGATSERGRIVGGAGMSRRGMVFTRDQIGGSTRGVSTYGNNYYAWAFDADGDLVGASIEAAPGFSCDQGAFYFLGNTTGQPAFSPNGNCSFNFNSVAANEASIENESVFLRGDYQINDNWNVYSAASSTKTESFGRYAPVPGVVRVEDGTPNDVNFGERCDSTPGACASDGLPTYYFHRFAAAGNRDNFTDSTNRDFLLGFEGQLTDTIGVDFGIRRTDYKYLELGRGYIVGSLANAAANNGDYLLNDPFGADESVLNSFKVTINRESRYSSDEIYAQTFFDVFEMAGGISNAVIGAEHREDTFTDQYDSLSEAGVVLGSAGNSSGGERSVSAVFFEWLFPFTTTFDMTVAGRYDNYSDYGNDFSPKVSFRWQPLDALTFRGSYGQGFRAPPLDILSQKTTFSAEPVNDPQSCAALGQPTTCQLQVDTFFVANPDLLSEQSKQYSLGVVWAPLDWLDMSLDHYNITVEDTIVAIGAQDIINSDLDPGTYGPIPAGLGLVRNPLTGRITSITAGYANAGELNTNGYDFRLNTNFDLGAMGNLRNQLMVSYIDEYEITDPNGVKTEYTGLEGTPHGRASLRNAWGIGDWTFGFNSNYIHHQPTVTSSGRGPGGYTTHDVQIAWEAPWNATVAVGAINVGDRYPELNAYDGRPWNFYLYDANGRTTYFRYTQRF